MFRKKVQSLDSSSDASSNNGTNSVDSGGQNNKNADQAMAEKDGKAPAPSENRFRHLFGFEKEDLLSWSRFVRLLCRPTDPANLGTMRFLYGLMMVLDVCQERGLAAVDSRWGSEEECRFPLFNFLKPLPLQWMCVVYLIMLLGAVGIMLGFKFRYSCWMFLITYWYIFFLDKTSWNNHSYLFGIIAFLFALSDANRYWSIDGLLDPKIYNAHIPLWNYTLFRAQIFLVYFIAGLKKLDADWVTGYSMQYLSTHWVFNVFALFMTDEQIDLYIVHLGGLFIDLSVGFLMFFEATQEVGFTITTMFNCMNAIIFNIGMFPYAMLTSQIVFCKPDFARKAFNDIPPALRLITPDDGECQISPHCIYDKDSIKSEIPNPTGKKINSKEAPPTSANLKHKLASLFTVFFIAWQCFLPWSHGVTKGYNNWTNGLYGYSWDMMVHSWSIQHIRITYYDKDTGQSGYLDPMVWSGNRQRWSSHGDMIKQYASCIAENLKEYNISNVELYFDIWRSLNFRFQQRMVDPRVDMITAEWNPFKSPPWLMPLLVDLSDWRARLQNISNSVNNTDSEYTETVFLADFPGLYLENFVQPDFKNTTITVLAGKVTVELIDQGVNVTLGPEESYKVPADMYHNVHTISETPSCYMYQVVNTTAKELYQNYKQFEDDYKNSSSLNETLKKYDQDPNLAWYQTVFETEKLLEKQESQSKWDRLKAFLKNKYFVFRRSLRLSMGALYCLITNNSFNEFLNATYQRESGREDSML